LQHITSKITDIVTILQSHILLHQDPSFSLVAVPNSVILSAPKGAGKSIYIQTLQSLLQMKYSSCTILSSSCKSLARLHYTTYQQTQTMLSQDYPLLTKFEQQLFLLLILLFDRPVASFESWYALYHSSSSQHHQQQRPRTGICLCLDDLDILFGLFSTSLDQENQSILLDNEYTRLMKLIAHHLNQLLIEYNLMVMNNNNASKPSNYILLVIGTTSLLKNELPRKQLDCPEFDLFLSFLKPNEQDLQAIWTNELTKQCTKECVIESIDVFDENESENDIKPNEKEMIIRWSQRLAQLTKGYTYGDIIAVLQQAILYIQGNSRHHSVANTKQNNTTKLLLSWQMMMQALATVPLKALNQLDFLSNTISNTSSSSSSSWDMFYGYEPLKQQLQQRLFPYFHLFSSLSSSSSSSSSGSNSSSNSSLLQKAIHLLPKGMVIYGSSGCGKTYLAKCLAKELHMNLLPITSTQLLSKYFGQTELHIRKLFTLARQITPCILFFDDFDALAHKR